MGIPTEIYDHFLLIRRSNILKRFNRSYTVDHNGCYVWQKAVVQGLPKLFMGKIDDENIHGSAVRLSYLLFNGHLTLDERAFRTCDNPSCVNPAHLRKQ